MIHVNDGDRPSHLELDRYATGELSPEEAAALLARLDAPARRHLEAVEGARSAMPPFDAARIRARAAALDRPAGANNTRHWVVGLAIAAAVLLVALPAFLRPDSGTRFRTGDGLELFRQSGESLVPYATGTPVGEADVLGFRVVASGHRGVVVLSVDGTGTTTVYWPESGERPEPLAGDGFVALPGTVVLDGAPGPEVFVAVFDRSVSAARSEVERTFQSGGHPGLVEWAEAAPNVAAVEITRR